MKTLVHKTYQNRIIRSLRWALGGISLALLLDSPAMAHPLLQEAVDNNTVWPILMPLGTAAIGVERAIEVIWNYVEWALLNGRSWQPADLKSPQYLQFKSGTSMLLGLIVGILVANYTNMRLFEYLKDFTPGFIESVPALWDTLITGLIIGAGAKPAHEILGLITNAKNFLGNASINQRENAGAALAEGILKLAESENRRMVDVPGLGPSRIPSPAASARGMTANSPIPEGMEGEDITEGPPAPMSDMERYAQMLQNRTAY